MQYNTQTKLLKKTHPTDDKEDALAEAQNFEFPKDAANPTVNILSCDDELYAVYSWIELSEEEKTSLKVQQERQRLSSMGGLPRA